MIFINNTHIFGLTTDIFPFTLAIKFLKNIYNIKDTWWLNCDVSDFIEIQ